MIALNARGETDSCDVRGGSYKSGSSDLTCEIRLAPARNCTFEHIGFRCCDDPG